MENSYTASTISFRRRTPPLWYDCPNPYYYYHCSLPPPLFPSRTACCYCCSNSLCGFSLSPIHCCSSLNAFRQSSLIQRSPSCRKVVPQGIARRSYSRVPFYGADVSNVRERMDRVCNVRVKRLVGGFRKRMVFEERIDEAEILLNFLAEDVYEDDEDEDDGCFIVRKEDKRKPIKKPILEKRESVEVCNGCGNRKKKAGIDASESGLRIENLKERTNGECSNSSSKNRAAREREKGEKSSRITEVENIRRNRKEVSDSKLLRYGEKSQEREDSSKKEEQRERLRRDGSSCSSYYSLSLTGDYEGEADQEIKEGFVRGESSSGYKGDSRSSEMVLHRKDDEEKRRYEDYKEEESEFMLKKKKKSTSKESDFRKKTEKKLADMSIEEVDSRDRSETTLRKDEKVSVSRESDYYVENDDRRLKLSQAVVDGVSRRQDGKMKYKRFLEGQENRVSTDLTANVYGSEKVNAGKTEMASQVVSSSRGDVRDHRSSLGVVIREDEYRKTSRKDYEVTKMQEIDVQMTSVTDQRFQTSVKEENVVSSTNNASEDRETFNQASFAPSGKLGSSIFGQQLNEITLQEETVDAEDDKTESEILVKLKPSSSNLQSTDELLLIESTAETLRSDSSALPMFSPHEDFSKSSSPFVTRNETQSSEDKNEEINVVLEESRDQENSVQQISVDSQSNKSDSKDDENLPPSKGPRDEMWRVEEPPSANEESEAKDEKALAKRSGKTLWNVISDIVLLRWSPRHESTPSSGKKTAGKTSPNQSTSSEGWFSGQEPEDLEQTAKRGSPPIVNPKVEEASSSLPSVSLPPGKDVITTSSSTALVDPKTRLPSLKLRRSPIVRAVSEYGETSAIDGGDNEQPNEEEEGKLKKLQRKDQMIKSEFDEWEEAYRFESEQRKIDEVFMREALLEAEKAADNWEVPVGAVLVHRGKIIARGYNLVEEMRDSTAHAEMACIRQASNVLRSWRLSETTLYVTLEPCPMCAGAILQARVDCVVWGAPNKLLGADGSWIRLFPSGGNEDGLEKGDKPSPPIHPFHPKIVVRRGVLSSECADMMEQFFKLRRKKKEGAIIKPEGPTPPTAVACLPISRRHPAKFFTKMHSPFHLMFCL